MAKNKGGPPGETNEMFLIVAIVALVAVVLFTFKTRIAGIVLGIKYVESYPFSLVFSDLVPLRLWMLRMPRDLVKYSDMYVASDMVGGYFRFVAIPLLGWMGYKLVKSSPTERFRRRFTETTLPKVEADLYPWMAISTKLDFASMDPEKGPWAYALTERMFAREHGLKNERGEYDAERAERVFVRQLGSIWLGYKNLKPHAKAIFAMLSARVNKDYKTSDQMLFQLARSASNGKLDYTGVDEMAQKYIDTPPIKRIIRQHAYERTVLMTLLEAARGGESGKDYLPPNWFLWLKGVDRGLWYALSDIGRTTPHVESAGVFGHWLTEKMRKKRLEMPSVKKAVSGLQMELAKYTEDGDRDLSFDDPDIEIKTAPEVKIPTPEEVEEARMRRSASGK